MQAVISRLKGYDLEQRNLEYVFGKHLLRSQHDNHLYYDLEVLERKFKSLDRCVAEYMLVKVNLKNLTSQIDDSSERGKAVKIRLEAIDLDAVIAYEVDLFAPVELRRYLMQIKDEVLLDRLRYQVKESMTRTKEIMEVNLRGDVIHAADQLETLRYQRWILYAYNHSNFLMIDQLSSVREIHRDIFQAYLYRFLTPGFGQEEFDLQLLTDVVLHIHPRTLSEMLEEVPVLAVSEATRKGILGKASNLLRSHFVTGGFSGLRQEVDMKAQMLDSSSCFYHYEVFSLLFMVIAKMGCCTDDVRGISPDIINFLLADPKYFDQYMKTLSALIEHFGDAFSVSQFLQVLQAIIPKLESHHLKHDRIVKGILKSWRRHFPQEKIKEVKLIHQAVVNHMGGSNPEYLRLGHLWHITAPELQDVIVAELERFLDLDFNAHLFQCLVHEGVLAVDHKDYFSSYVKEQVAHNTPDGFWHSDGKLIRNPSIDNMAILVHRFDVPLYHPALLDIVGLTPYQSWLLNPDGFEYSGFEVLWLKEAFSVYFFKKLKGNVVVKATLEAYLKESFDEQLTKIYFKYLA
ncbi:hypothetical protein SAMN05443550_109222 [Pedobacter hartonius]|uniref:Uncharacterized protein n=2 Tax=Pedobacter hartonius TaxID=425514 RepID=A0A1H4GF15_9SPHI|nr:hypothetical protein SAMN05443550_109222 [Pedobacter hartonius]